MAAPPLTPPWLHDLTAPWNSLTNGNTPVLSLSPFLILLFDALIAPGFKPIPAFFDIYSMIAEVDALIESKVSSHSIKTQEENCLVLVLTPLIIGVGNEILNNDAAS